MLKKFSNIHKSVTDSVLIDKENTKINILFLLRSDLKNFWLDKKEMNGKAVSTSICTDWF